jgi:hypothetical protein
MVPLLFVIGVRALAGQGVVTEAQVRAAADTSRELRVIVSLRQRKLRVVAGSGDTLYMAPVAVGSNSTLRSGGRTWRFATPRGISRVLSTEIEPLWIRPDWAFIELARKRGLRLDSVSAAAPRALKDGRTLVVRGTAIGTLQGTDADSFEPWPVDRDIVIGGVLYKPPFGTPHRAQAGVLGRYRLSLGDAIGFHGTSDKESVGKAATHGCMRLHDADIEWLYLNVPVGTPVFIY